MHLPTLEPAGALAAQAPPQGYGKDPALLKAYKAGELWPLTLNAEQRRIASTLSDAIVPRDGTYPSASEVRVVDFIDEWVSAPYAPCAQDRAPILNGLAWVDAYAREQFRKPFAELTESAVASICDDVCPGPNARTELRTATDFFTRYRRLTAIGYYTSPVGMRDLGYVGNVPLKEFAGPPAEVLRRLDLA